MPCINGVDLTNDNNNNKPLKMHLIANSVVCSL